VLQLSVALPHEVSDALGQVEKKLDELSFNGFYATKLSEASLHLVKAKGKLLRPILVLLGSHCANGINELSIEAATAVEVIHTASLIHDDLIDGDTVRRGVATVHTVFGSEIAVLSGDLLISKAIELSAPCGRQAIKELAQAAMDMCEGEARDFEVQKSGRKIGIEEYMDIVKLKTASLIGACAAIGGRVSNGGENLINELKEYGRNIGIAFQIRDDYLNVLGESLDKPKSTGNDIIRNRPNVVSALNLEFDLDTSLKLALEMNRKYVSKAREEAAKIGRMRDMLSGYAKLMLLKPRNETKKHGQITLSETK
jgi:geranylgeranyl pyrophosphate synthase